MPVETFEKALDEMIRTGIVRNDEQIEIDYSVAGDPFHAPLHQFTRVAKSKLHYPKVYSFTSLDVPSKELLLERSEGLRRLTVSLDDHHYAHFLRKAIQKGRRGKAAQAEALRDIAERIGWVNEATAHHGILPMVRLTGSRTEQEKWRAFAKQHVSPTAKYDPQSRDPPGSRIDLPRNQVYLLANGLITNVVPVDRPPL